MEQVSKLDSARRHLDEAIKLFFEERDPLVVHTLAAAAQGTLKDIARATGAKHLSILHDHPAISAADRKRWIDMINKPRNFFKHADKDHAAFLDFDEQLNIETLLDAVLLYWTIGGAFLSSANVFMGWFTTRHPEMRTAVSNDQIGDYAVRNGISPDDKARFRELIEARVLIEPNRSN